MRETREREGEGVRGSERHYGLWREVGEAVREPRALEGGGGERQ